MKYFLENVDPLSKFFWVLFIGITLLFSFDPTYGILIFVFISIIAVFGTNISFTKVKKELAIIFLIPLCIFIFHLFIHPGEVVLDFNFVTITDQSIKMGSIFFFRFASVIAVSFLFILTTNIKEFMVGLIKLGMPYQLAFTVFLILRFIPVMTREMTITRDAYKAKGLLVKRGFKKRIYLWQRYLFTAIIKGLRIAERTNIAMESRAFGAYPVRTYNIDFKWSASGILLNTIFIFLFISIFFYL